MSPALAEKQRAVAAVAGLQPPALWRFFAELSQIPRPSKHEERVLEWVKAFANERSLNYRQDTVGNLVIYRSGSGGGEGAPAVVIQGHLDMVTEKNSNVEHDFFADGLTLRRTEDDAWLMASGTTLGADNGIGVCAALALLDAPQSTKLPPLECLFTVDEETGLTGAFQLDASMLSGRTMLNLDTEDWPEIFIGCAGGGDSRLSLPVAFAPVPVGAAAFQVTVTGLMGGHSGLNINEGRGNAVVFAARAADAIVAGVPGARLAAIVGGDKRNAIPREASATLTVPAEDADKVGALASDVYNALTAEYGALESDLALRWAPVQQVPDQALEPADAAKVLALLLTLPHGVMKYSHTVPGLVETSSNLAAVRCELGEANVPGAECAITCSSRSSLMPALEAVRSSIAKLAGLVGARLEQEDAYPGWQPDPSSAVLQLTREVLHEITGAPPKVGAIHAGLECGILGAKVPGMDMVSYGPTIRGAHSPEERVEVATVAPFWEATLRLLGRLADRRT
ncbi:hypothetical protein WJX81_005747 [Elliptochloris bilobata]|uniref:Peptidase M20 dimerisation domain-containing protein n=1 Tax=Elliptochloris bilobata TaxID=381761 RepID=A0AAW1QYI5_9CHLO